MADEDPTINPEPSSYENNGTEYRFCLNEFEDMQNIINQHAARVDVGSGSNTLPQKVFKCSLSVFKMYYTKYTNDEMGMPPLEIQVLGDEDNSS